MFTERTTQSQDGKTFWMWEGEIWASQCPQLPPFHYRPPTEIAPLEVSGWIFKLGLIDWCVLDAVQPHSLHPLPVVLSSIRAPGQQPHSCHKLHQFTSIYSPETAFLKLATNLDPLGIFFFFPGCVGLKQVVKSNVSVNWKLVTCVYSDMKRERNGEC